MQLHVHTTRRNLKAPLGVGFGGQAGHEAHDRSHGRGRLRSDGAEAASRRPVQEVIEKLEPDPALLIRHVSRVRVIELADVEAIDAEGSIGNDGAALPMSPQYEEIPESVRRPRVSRVAPELQLADMPAPIERENRARSEVADAGPNLLWVTLTTEG